MTVRITFRAEASGMDAEAIGYIPGTPVLGMDREKVGRITGVSSSSDEPGVVLVSAEIEEGPVADFLQSGWRLSGGAAMGNKVRGFSGGR